MIKILLMFYLVFTIGCAYEVSPESRNKTINCKDTRDGETFSFNTNTVKNIHRTADGVCCDIIDNKGKERSLCKDQEIYLKCEQE